MDELKQIADIAEKINGKCYMTREEFTDDAEHALTKIYEIATSPETSTPTPECEQSGAEEQAFEGALHRYLMENQDSDMSQCVTEMLIDWAMDAFGTGWDAAIEWYKTSPHINKCEQVCSGEIAKARELIQEVVYGLEPAVEEWGIRKEHHPQFYLLNMCQDWLKDNQESE